MIDVSNFYGLVHMECRRCGLTRVYPKARAFRWLETHLRGCTKPGRVEPAPPPKPARPPRKPWTPEHDHLALTMAPADAAKLMGRTADAVRTRRNKLNRKATS